jgi:lysophospholipase L1-like esterase
MSLGRGVFRFALGVQLLLALSVAKQWLCVGTYRFYLDRKSEPSSASVPRARERFDVVGGRVEPQILTTEDDRLSFPVAFPWGSRLEVRATPVGRATVEIAVVERGRRLTLSRRSLSAPADITLDLPPLTGQLELVNEGALRWSDPRVVQDAAFTPQVVALLALVVLQGLWMRRHPEASLLGAGRARLAFLGALSAVVSVSAGLVVVEVGLRAMGERLPEWIAADRRNLGEVRADGQWQDSMTYGARLRPGLATSCEWRDGDIVRLGFLPPEMVRHPLYRFPFFTDAEGFRNRPGAEDAAPVAALGDSFTDAMTLPAELGWPARLSARLGVEVRNYGTAGFGPGQERRVLEEYVLRRRPRVVIVAFFAGNDLQDAERFAHFEQDGSFRPSFAHGWKFKEVVARFDHPYVASLARGLPSLLQHPSPGRGEPTDPDPEGYSGDDPKGSAVSRAGFDRGLFTVPVAGRTLRFAFLPAYLNILQFSRSEIEAWPGWALTREAYRQMARETHAAGARLVVMFIPHKAQVYLPILQASLTPPELRRALEAALRQAEPVDLRALADNRLAMNGLMRDFCAEEGIELLDLTEALEARVAKGENVYFPDDSHWNAAGHESASEALEARLRARGGGVSP